MITVTKTDSAVQFTFSGSQHYLYDGTMEVPFNSLILVEDESDMITFRKASTNDILFSAMYTEFSSLGETKDAVVSALEDMMFAEGGGGGGVDPEDVVEIVESALTEYWTSAQTQSAINQASSGKQDTLISGTNIKTINNQSLLGSGDITISGGSSSYVYYSEDSENKTATIHIENTDGGTVGELLVDGESVNMYASMTEEEKGSTIETHTDITNNPNGIAMAYEKNTGDETTDAYSHINVEEGTISMQVYVEGGENTLEIGDGGVTVNGEYVVTVNDIPSYSAGTGIDITDNVISATGGGSSNIVEVTQAQYDALVSGGTVDPDSLYIISDASEVNLSGYALSSAVTAEISAAVSGKADSSAVTQSLSSKQDTLVSGTNIKTINNESLLGSGDITISGGGGAYYIDIATLGIGITDEDWDSVVAAIDAHRPIYAGYPRQDGGIYYYGVECMNKNVSNTEIVLTASDDNQHYFYTFTKNGSNDYSYTVATKPYVPTISTAVTSGSTDAEIPTAKATYDAIQAGGGGGATYSAGKNISIDTANTINCTLNLENGTNSTSGGIKLKSNAAGNKVSGRDACAFGGGNNANGINSFVTGYYNSGNTDSSFISGYKNKTTNNMEVLFGQLALSNGSQSSDLNGNSGCTLFAVGNGDWRSVVRHNALDIRQNGDIYFPDTDNTTYQNYYEKPMVRLQDMYGALGGLKFISLTQSEYDQLATKDSTTIYFIKNNSN